MLLLCCANSLYNSRAMNVIDVIQVCDVSRAGASEL